MLDEWGDVVDAATAALLAAAAIVAALLWVRDGADRRATLGWVWMAAGLTLLAADEFWNLQPRVEEWLHHAGFPDPPLLNGTDDVFLLAAGGLALTVCVRYRRELFRVPQVQALLGAAAALFVVALLIDSVGPTQGPLPRIEELAELATAALILAALLLRWGLASRFEPRATPIPVPLTRTR